MKRSLLHKSIFSTLLLAATLPVFLSCSQEEKTEELPPSVQAPAAMPVQNSRWKYFDTSSDGSVQLKSVDAVSEIPAVQFKPWTEAVRVTDCGFNHEQAVFLINKCGVYPIHSLQSGQPLPAKHSLFSQTSAGDLYNVDGHYFIRIYQNPSFYLKIALRINTFYCAPNLPKLLTVLPPMLNGCIFPRMRNVKPLSREMDIGMQVLKRIAERISLFSI